MNAITMRRFRKPAAGFTIAELMVTIGITGVLISILFSAFAKAKSSAGEVKSLSNARGVAMSMQAYTDSFGNWPFAKPGVAPPEFQYPDIVEPDKVVVPMWPNGYIGLSNEWQLAHFWPGLVAKVAPWEENYQAWVSPGRTNPALYDDKGLPTDATVSYVYSNSFVGSPALWREGSTPDDSLIAPTTPSMVDHPSNKVLTWDGDLAYLPRRPQQVDGLFAHITPMAFADQHADMRNPLDATPGVANPLNGDYDARLHNTPAGVLGRDY